MAEQTEHPSIKSFRERAAASLNQSPSTCDAEEIRAIALNAGADDVGFVEVDRAELTTERDDILRFFPATKSRLVKKLVPVTALSNNSLLSARR